MNPVLRPFAGQRAGAALFVLLAAGAFTLVRAAPVSRPGLPSASRLPLSRASESVTAKPAASPGQVTPTKPVVLASPAPAYEVPTEVTTTIQIPGGPTVDYAGSVAPLVDRLGCARLECHGARTGKSGFRLSLFGADPESDASAIAFAAGGRRVSMVDPAGSLLLLKITGALPHGGGKITSIGSRTYNTLLAWISQGAVYRIAGNPSVQSVVVSPARQTLAKGKGCALKVMAVFSDGTRKDVTRLALFRSNRPDLADVSDSGQVVARRSGEGCVVATYLRHSDVARVIVPQPLPFAFPTVPTNNRVDELCLAQEKQLGCPPSDLCTDAVFLRRVYLDTIGILPTPDEARAFLSDRAPDRRSRLIDRLLERDEFADFWAMKWGDLLRIKSEFPVVLWPKGVQTYYRWVRDSLAANKPYDQFARELVAATGSDFRSGPSNFLRAVNNKDPQTIGETTALIFMGARIGCARCHGDPYENWTLSDDLGNAAFFAGVKFKGTEEWKEEIVYDDPDAVLLDPRTRAVVPPRFLDGTVPATDASATRLSPREAFARWLTSPDNPWFTRCIANRVWFWLMGRGLVNEPDDLRPTNPPTNPQLLDYLAHELVNNRYDLKSLYRLILNSRTYQLSSAPTRWNQDDTICFSHYATRRLESEQLLDAICQVTGTHESFSSIIPEPYTHLPADTRSEQVADGSIDTAFLELMGRPPRDTPYESDRCSRISIRQVLHLLNSSEIESKITSGTRLNGLITAGKTDSDIIDELYLAALSRFPTDRERQTAIAYLVSHKTARSQALQDILWAILNTKEFIFDH